MYEHGRSPTFFYILLASITILVINVSLHNHYPAKINYDAATTRIPIQNWTFPMARRGIYIWYFLKDLAEPAVARHMKDPQLSGYIQDGCLTPSWGWNAKYSKVAWKICFVWRWWLNLSKCCLIWSFGVLSYVSHFTLLVCHMLPWWRDRKFLSFHQYLRYCHKCGAIMLSTSSGIIWI